MTRQKESIYFPADIFANSEEGFAGVSGCLLGCGSLTKVVRGHRLKVKVLVL